MLYAEVKLPANPVAPREARSFTVDVLGPDADAEMVDVAELLVSEVTTQAVHRGDQPIHVSVRVGDDDVRVEVADGSGHGHGNADLLATGDPVPERPGRLVERLAHRCGAERITGNGTRVWFELPLTD